MQVFDGLCFLKRQFDAVFYVFTGVLALFAQKQLLIAC